MKEMSVPLLVIQSGDLRAEIAENKGRGFIHGGDYAPEEIQRIETEFRESGKAFLFSNNGVEGAVYGPHAHWLIPAECLEPEKWVRKNLRPLIAETGIFSELAEEAQAKIDARAELLSGNVFFHTGDLGDIIAALPAIRSLGGGYLILGNRHGRGGREQMNQARFNVIAPLLDVQPYLTGVEFLDDAPAVRHGTDRTDETNKDLKSIVTHDFTRFREHRPPEAKRPDGSLGHGGAGYNLATWQGSYFGVKEVDLSPWLHVPDGDTELRNEVRGKAIFARTERYHNPKFDWIGIVKAHAPALFVGLEDEWNSFQTAFCGSIGADVRHRPVANFLEVAQMIDGSKSVVGNQSAPMWIAMAMGHRLIQETDQWNLNSVVERHNAEYRM